MKISGWRNFEPKIGEKLAFVLADGTEVEVRCERATEDCVGCWGVERDGSSRRDCLDLPNCDGRKRADKTDVIFVPLDAGDVRSSSIQN